MVVWGGGCVIIFWEIWRGVRANLPLLRGGGGGIVQYFSLQSSFFASPPPNNFCTLPNPGGEEGNFLIWAYRYGQVGTVGRVKEVFSLVRELR